ncbi:hypothetical protein Tco_0940185 [Tanacetum coccineum]|uniref:Alpha/beta hydrolases superfamily protein n=1 Tax=Tanacetum coccineum TaxID=301880 RepID=A0ABQ5DMB2_9ASTR
MKTELANFVPFEKQSDDLKKRLAKNNEAKMVSYNALPRKEYKEFSCVIRQKKYGKRNLKVHEMIIKKDSEIVKAKGERKSLALKAKKESNDEECSTSESKDEEYTMAVRDFKKFLKRRGRKCLRCGDPNHLIGECLKPPKDKNQRAFIEGSWGNSDEGDDEKAKDEACLMAHASSEVPSESSYFSDENSSVDDCLESKVMRECSFVVGRDAWLRGKFTLSPLDVLQGFSFFLQMGFTLILATLDGLDVGLLGDVIGEDDCDDDG